MASSNSFGPYELHKWSCRSVQEQKTPTSPAAPASHSWKRADDVKNNPKIPDSALFCFPSRVLNPNKVELPQISECAAHLELLQTFYYLRRRVLLSKSLETALGIKAEPRTVYRRSYSGYRRGYRRTEVELQDKTYQARKMEKWPFFLSLAAARFTIWADAFNTVYTKNVSTDQKILYSLPPLDVLMVWHALLFNPSLYRTTGLMPDIPFPWEQIHNAIQSDDIGWPYVLSLKSTLWCRQIGLDPDLLELLIQPNQSSTISEVLLQHGTVGSDKSRGINRSAVAEAMRNSAKKSERDFLKCLHTGAENNALISDLVSAVERQVAFVEKMELQLWIRSPGLEGILNRAINRYSDFLKLFKYYPKIILVPTLDIDLIWHTHQCSPAQYEIDILKIAGKIINHDDKLGKTTLDVGIKCTRDLYRIRYAKEYCICTCWDCTLLLDFISERDTESHNNFSEIAQRIDETVAYYRAVEILRRKGTKLLLVR